MNPTLKGVSVKRDEIDVEVTDDALIKYIRCRLAQKYISLQYFDGIANGYCYQTESVSVGGHIYTVNRYTREPISVEIEIEDLLKQLRTLLGE